MACLVGSQVCKFGLLIDILAFMRMFRGFVVVLGIVVIEPWS